MKLTYIIFACALSANLIAQKQFDFEIQESHPIEIREARFHRVHDQANPLVEKSAIASYVTQQIAALSDVELRLQHESTSPMGKHYLFGQYIQNVEVYYSQVRVNLDKHGFITSVLENTYRPGIAQNGTFPVAQEMEMRFSIAQPNGHIESQGAVWFYNGVVLEPAYQITWHAQELGAFETVYNSNFEELFNHNLHRNHHANCQHHHALDIDTTVSVMVFDPDPLTQAEVLYGPPYVHMNNQNTAVLDPLRVQRTTTADFANGQFHKRNAYIRLEDFEAPNNPVLTSTTPSFNYSRNHPSFEQTMCLYHVTSFQEHLQSLGFSIAQFPIIVDANGVNGQDNAYFTWVPSPRMAFGPGGVPDAEDADVIYHEYTHALFYDVAPGTSMGNERRCLEEAHADYFATSYSKSIKNFNANRMFSWDGHNEFWQGRWATNNNNKIYTSLNFGSNIYTHTDIWVATVMQVWDRIGRTCTDKIATQAMYGTVANMTMRQFALLMLDAHGLCGGFPEKAAIAEGLSTYLVIPTGLSTEIENTPEKSVQLINSIGFTRGESLRLIFNTTGSHYVTVINGVGQRIAEGKLNSNEWSFSGAGLASGLYVIDITLENGQTERFKVLR
jgi:hypothetical protein